MAEQILAKSYASVNEINRPSRNEHRFNFQVVLQFFIPFFSFVFFFSVLDLGNVSWKFVILNDVAIQ